MTDSSMSIKSGQLGPYASRADTSMADSGPGNTRSDTTGVLGGASAAQALPDRTSHTYVLEFNGLN